MMKNVAEVVKNHPILVYLGILVLLPFALFINLGLMPLISDEPTRAVVTLEMILSGNYITPTINGEFYYNKPPLFNWLLAGVVALTGNMNEFTLRLPTVISLILLAFSIFLFSRKTLGWQHGALSGLMIVLSARILFWDSFQGLIDLTYSLVTFWSFMALYHFSDRKQWLPVFVITYGCAAAGFLMKGFPSVAFQGISLLVWLTYLRSFRKLFSWQHLAGIAFFAMIAGTYYYFYLQTNSLQDLFSTLIDQSNRLNDKEGSIGHWLGHLVVFPFEMSYEFAPWTLLLLLLFNKSIRQAIFSDRLITFSLLMFLSNIVIYWISADMRPRYLFMLFPLLFVVLTKAWQAALAQPGGLLKFVNTVFQLLAFAGALSLLVYPFWSETRDLMGVRILIPVLLLISLSAAFLILKIRQLIIPLLMIVLLTVRIAFNLYNLPARYASYPDAGYRAGEIRAGGLTRGHPVYVLGDTPFNHDASFYISRENGSIVRRVWSVEDSAAFYIADRKNLANFASIPETWEVKHEFTIKLNETRLLLIKKKP